MKDKTQLITSLDFAYDAIKHECYNDALSSILEAKEAAQQILDLCQPKWIYVPEVSADIEWCRVIIGGCEQELFYRCIDNTWEFQTDNGLWAKSGFVPNYYFVMPKLPGESE